MLWSCSNSSRGRSPLTRICLSLILWKGRTSSVSNSSWISPTTSSMRSSKVTRPAVPDPNSSITTAIWMLDALNILSKSLILTDSETY